MRLATLVPSAADLPLSWPNALLLSFITIAVLIGALLGLFSFMTWVERRVLAFMQFRLGPNRTGPLGLLQPIADGIKLFFKEELVPDRAQRLAFLLAPAISVIAALMAIAVIPYGPPLRIPNFGFIPAAFAGRVVPLQIVDLDVGILYLFAVSSLGVYGIVLAGWSANNKFTLLGALRSAAQMISYELSLGLSWVGVILLCGSLKLTDIVAHQSGSLLAWNLVLQFPAFLIYVIAATAEVNRLPFDLAEAEAELVAGFHTEYGSMKFALLQMAEYINMITVAVLATLLFLGGWHAPLPILASIGPVPLGMPWFALKVFALLFFFIWMRGTLPRFRYDQLMRLGFKVLIPVATLNILLTGAAVLKGWL